MNLLNSLGLGRRKRYVRVEHITHWHSNALERNVSFDIYFPREYGQPGAGYFPLLLINDGQDLPRMDFKEILRGLYRNREIPPMVVVGIHAGPARTSEYGTTRQVDYKGRGDKAPAYKSFIMSELLPYLYENYTLTELASERIFAGFSLGALSALDIAWSEPEVFGGAGVFSGALWWRWADVRPEDPDADRIMHDIILNSTEGRPNDQFFWFQVGTMDEEEDRNNNGIIDAIDDTLDCIGAIQSLGYHDGQIRYIEINDGTHDPGTWGYAMPDFLTWMFTEDEDL